MTLIKSNLETAATLSTNIQKAASTAVPEDVSAAANVTVTVNQECLDIYNEAKAICARYQTVGSRDGGYLQKYAALVKDLDQDCANSISSKGS